MMLGHCCQAAANTFNQLRNLSTLAHFKTTIFKHLAAATVFTALAVMAADAADISRALKPGKNKLRIGVTNLWPNRMIGDEHEPDDAEWGGPFRYSYAPGNPIIGRFLARVPQWLVEGKPRPSQGRYTFVSFKFFTKDSPLFESGLLGPVTLRAETTKP